MGRPIIGHGSADKSLGGVGIRQIDTVEERTVRLKYADDSEGA